MKNSSRNFIGVIVAAVILGALVNFIGVLGVGSLALKFFGAGGVTVATLLALVATGAINYALFVAAMHKHFKQKAEDELVAEIEADQPRRFDDVNFR